MNVYRICLAKWADRLVASGNAARWNSQGRFVIYTAASQALACLENLVHRSGEGLQAHFKVLVIEVPESLAVAEVEATNLPDDWFTFLRYPDCQRLVDQWLEQQATAVLRVPSAIIPGEYNYLLNPHHPDFAQVRIGRVADFVFDPRIKG